MRPGDTARLYHRLTAYEPEREWDTPVDDPHVLREFEPNVLARFPAHCKSCRAGLPVLPALAFLGYLINKQALIELRDSDIRSLAVAAGITVVSLLFSDGGPSNWGFAFGYSVVGSC